MNGITKANYYLRLRKVREAVLGTGDVTTAFVEILTQLSQELVPKFEH